MKFGVFIICIFLIAPRWMHVVWNCYAILHCVKCDFLSKWCPTCTWGVWYFSAIRIKFKTTGVKMEARPTRTVLHLQPWMSVQPATQHNKNNPTTNTCWKYWWNKYKLFVCRYYLGCVRIWLYSELFIDS